MPNRYKEWLLHVFDRPETANGWYFDVDDIDFVADSNELVELVTFTLENCKADLASYSEGQINDGLNFIFNNACSDIVFAFKDAAVVSEKRLKAIRALKTLYRDCFEQRCAPVLSHLNEQGSNPLNLMCYMFWDVSPIARWEKEPQQDAFYRTVIEVLDYALGLQNPACVESALHGLGHLYPYCPNAAAETISLFLRKNPSLPLPLKNYAENAQIGYVQ